MGKAELKKQMNEVVAKIKVNSKDAHYADTLIDALLSLKGQIDIEPTLIHIPSDDIVEKLESETFRLALCKSGDVVYHLKGGMDIVVQPKAESLYNHLVDTIRMQESIKALDEEQQRIFESDVVASTYVLNIPFLAFGDLEFKYKLANIVIDYLVELQDKMLKDAELQEETPVENTLFEEATMALEEMKNEIKDGE